MIRTAEIFLWETRIGILHQGEDDRVPTFEYDRDFIGSGIEVAPFKMPLSERTYTFPELQDSSSFHGLPGLVADSLPDKFGNAVIDLWLEHNGRERESMTPIERLCYTGKRGMGALEFVPAEKIDTSRINIDVTSLSELASEILSEKERHVYDAKNVTMVQMLEIGSSAGGSRAKAVIAWNRDTNEMRSGQVDVPSGFDQWLIKFDKVRNNGDHGERDGKQYTLIEYAYHLMAMDAGIDMTECRILEKDGMSHFMTKRFDRENGKKRFVQTLGALTHMDFNIPRACSYESYAGYAKRLGIGKEGIQEIYRRMVFNIIGMNCDDHVKNFAFIMDKKGEWSLSPAYDITFAYNPNNRWLCGHQMTINGKSNDISDDDMMSCGKKMGLSSRFCKTTIKHIQDVIEDWPDYAERCGIDNDTVLAIDSALKGNHT